VERSTLDIIIGREDELAEIERVLESVASAGSRALVIEGEPGIGKTSLGGGAARAVGDYVALVVQTGSGTGSTRTARCPSARRARRP
jgi:MoxR-like ATPase